MVTKKPKDNIDHENDKAVESLENDEPASHPSLCPSDDAVAAGVCGHSHCPGNDAMLFLKSRKKTLLNVRHFAIDKDYLHILVDEDLLHA